MKVSWLAPHLDNPVTLIFLTRSQTVFAIELAHLNWKYSLLISCCRYQAIVAYISFTFTKNIEQNQKEIETPWGLRRLVEKKHMFVFHTIFPKCRGTISSSFCDKINKLRCSADRTYSKKNASFKNFCCVISSEKSKSILGKMDLCR